MSRDADSLPSFLIGANLPWVHYGIDFGANGWRPAGGINQPEERGQLETTFARLAAAGVRCVRWFLFCDGRAGIRFSAADRPLGLDDFVFRDVDAALEIARRHDITIMFALFDFLWCDGVSVTHGVQMGGRAHVLADGEAREVLLDTVMRPLLERYGREPGIFGWDIINDPEWIKTVDETDLHAFLSDSVALIHSSATQPVTVGSAGVRWRNRYACLGLDFYQVHWYDSLKHQPPLETPVAELGFDRPVLLGEFPTRGSKRMPDEIVEAARAAGYSGAFYWSVLAKDECSAYPISSSAFTPDRMP
ncbi:MAG: hypothetical protein ABIS29_09630 [Vicinamibacterales bacterium]